MATSQADKDTPQNLLLSREEREVCEEYRVTGDEIAQKRAIALIALDEGHTQIQAGNLAGLTRGQVNYAVTLLKKHGVGIFQNTQLPQLATQADPAEPLRVESETPGKTKKKKGKKHKKKAKDFKEEKKKNKKKGKKEKDSKEKKKGKEKKKKDKKKKKNKS